MESLWNRSSLPRFERLEEDVKTDILIIGGGIAGVLCAYMLDRAGADYILIEADRICRGVTANTTAKITSQHGLIYGKLIREFGRDAARTYYDANERAVALYRKLCSNIDCDFEEKDAFVYSFDKTKLRTEAAALSKLGISAELTASLPLPISAAGAIRFRNQAQFEPLKFIAAISQNLNIYEQTKALSYDGRSVITPRAKITAKKIITATHFPFINKHGMYFAKMYQHRSYVLALEGAPDVGGMYVDESKSGLSFRNYKGMLLLGGGSHRTGKQGGGWAELREFAKKHYPAAREKYHWATQDCMTLDGVPYIGRYSRSTPDFYVTTGFNKWGMTSSMISAELLCDLLQGKENKYASIFSPSRTMLRPQLAVNLIETTANLLTPTTPRCPHLGCALKWNKHERTWDCPCHGSRFSEDGNLLDNPATDGLKSDPS